MTTITYICAIRYHQPVWAIEHLRKCLNYSFYRDDMCSGVHYNASDALKFAVMYDHVEYAEFLLQNYLDEALDSNLCCPILLLAVQHGCKDMVKLICNFASKGKVFHKGRPYIDACGCEAMENKKSPLHISTELGLVDITKVLLQYGADVGVKDRLDRTPLERTVQLILGASPTAHAQTSYRADGETPSPVQRLPARNYTRPERSSRPTTPSRQTTPRNRSRSRSPVSYTSSTSVSLTTDMEDHNKVRIDENALACVEELLKCQNSINEAMRQRIELIYQNKFGSDCQNLALDVPFSLLHHSRLAIRQTLGRWRLPNFINYLGLPAPLEQYINLNNLSLDVSVTHAHYVNYKLQ